METVAQPLVMLALALAGAEGDGGGVVANPGLAWVVPPLVLAILHGLVGWTLRAPLWLVAAVVMLVSLGPLHGVAAALAAPAAPLADVTGNDRAIAMALGWLGGGWLLRGALAAWRLRPQEATHWRNGATLWAGLMTMPVLGPLAVPLFLVLVRLAPDLVAGDRASP